MYSFNLDYIFNFVYNIFLAIRYAIVFWILRITPEQYLSDHQYDAWDGLRDRGWISTSTEAVTKNTDQVVYLGQVTNDHHSKAGDVVQQVKSVPWFQGLHFSIQNPILSFLADVLSVLAFFVILLLIYILFRWLALVLASNNQEKNKKREERLQAKINRINERSKQNEMNRVREETDRVNLENEVKKKLGNKEKNSKVESIYYKIEEKKIENNIENLPAGIPNLPIDENDLTSSEKEEIQADNNILLNYQVKNYIQEKENQILKVKSKNNLKFEKNSNIMTSIAIPAKDLEENINKDKKKAWYEERWQIILGYMRGSEDALIRIGIIEADNLLEVVLNDKGYLGNTLSEKLTQANFKSIDLAWSAHKIRNRIAHDGMNFVLTERIAKQTIESYRAVFKELKIIE